MSAVTQAIELPLISVIVPVFNEEENVDRCYQAICEVFETLKDAYRLEILFSDNHSTDKTFARLASIAANDPRVRVLRLARNFGFQRSLMTAYRAVKGAAAVQLDADLQDPPVLIKDFLQHWTQGHDVVVGVRTKRQEPLLLQMARKGFYRLLRRISDDPMIDDAGDFRLVDRTVIEHLRNTHDARPYTRGLISAFAANPASVPYERTAREFGQSKFPVRRLFGFAMDGIVAHSMVPLRLAGWIGAMALVFTVMMFAYYFVVFLTSGGNWPAGFATQTLLLLASIALNAILLGILGEYVGRIYEEVRVRPLSIIERSINIDPAEIDTPLAKVRVLE